MFAIRRFTLGAILIFLMCCIMIVKCMPTHHLTIGVQGNTPTLMVTSSEIDTTRLHKKTTQHKTLKSMKIKPKKVALSEGIEENLSQIYKNRKNANVTTATETIDIITTTTLVKPAQHFTSINDTLKLRNNNTVHKKKITMETTPKLVSFAAIEYKAMNKAGAHITPKTFTVQLFTPTNFSIIKPYSTTATIMNSKEFSQEQFPTKTQAQKNNEKSFPKEWFKNDITNKKEMTTQPTSNEIFFTIPNKIVNKELNVKPLVSQGNRKLVFTPKLAQNPRATSKIKLTTAEAPINFTPKMDTETTETILKLIDLEDNFLKANWSTLEQSSEQLHFKGHDGLKITKKKQLKDRHYLEVMPGNNLDQTKSTVQFINESSTLKSIINNKTHHKPIKYSSLGPIIMGERVFHKNLTTSVPRSKQFTTTSQISLFKKEPQRFTSKSPLAKGTSTKSNQPIAVLSTTVFEVERPKATMNTFQQPSKTMFTSKERLDEDVRETPTKGKTESKISDIQIEVYDSTIDSTGPSPKPALNHYNISTYTTAIGSTSKPSMAAAQQERFTQYVIDRRESSTQQSVNLTAIHVNSGKPEPAAIEIHINVSESFNGLTNGNENVDFNFSPNDYNVNARIASDMYDETKGNIKLKVPSNLPSSQPEHINNNYNGSTSSINRKRNGEILVIEVVNVDNNTTNNIKEWSINPDIKILGDNDELFMANTKVGSTTLLPPLVAVLQTSPTFNRDSDTIFYISNTEVKVGESLPRKNLYEKQRKSKLENQFFPIEYLTSTEAANVNDDEGADLASYHIYEEDIILSPNRNQTNTLKIYRNRNKSNPSLDIAYVGESVIDVEEQTPDAIIKSKQLTSQTPDIIIKPAILPEISIGVPVIGELPSQIGLKAIDVMPNQQHEYYSENSLHTNTYESNALAESSIQYGGDLIDESADSGFDGVEGSYPFGNPVDITNNRNHPTDYIHYTVNNGINNMRKDELSADIEASEEHDILTIGGLNSNNTILNLSYAVVETMVKNATLYSIMEESSELLDQDEGIVNLLSLIIGVFIIILPLVLSVSLFCVLRYIYKKYQFNTMNSDEKLDKPFSMDGESIKENKNEMVESASSFSLKITNKCQEATHKHPFIVTFNQERQDLHETNHYTNVKSSKNNDDCPLSVSLLPEKNPLFKILPSQRTNGSITKMTLENNILIVETEERNDISRVARETKMDYNKDGIFVVEVARGIDSKATSASPLTDNGERIISTMMHHHTKQNGNVGYKFMNEKHFHNNENVQVHSPPAENEEWNKNLHQIEEMDEPLEVSPKMETQIGESANLVYTGLSQSDLSSTSSDNSNKGYSYGNQEIYVIGNKNHQHVPSNIIKDDAFKISKSNSKGKFETSPKIAMNKSEHCEDVVRLHNFKETSNFTATNQIINKLENMNGGADIIFSKLDDNQEQIPNILNNRAADKGKAHVFDLPPPPPSPPIHGNATSENMYCMTTPSMLPPPPPLTDSMDLQITTNGKMLSSPLTPPASPPPPLPPVHCFSGSNGVEVQLTPTVNVTSS